MLQQPTAFSPNGCLKFVFSRLLEHRPLILKTLNHLTEVINNPEDQVSSNLGCLLDNATLFLGRLLSLPSGNSASTI